MDEKEYRTKSIEFTTLKNAIKYSALARSDNFNFQKAADEMGVSPVFLRRWANENIGLINSAWKMYQDEIQEEMNKLKGESNEKNYTKDSA